MLFLASAVLCRPSLGNDDAVRAAFKQFVAADAARDRTAAGHRLAEYGEAALRQILEGTEHTSEHVRACCYHLLIVHFLNDSRASDALMQATRDAEPRVAFQAVLDLNGRDVMTAFYHGVGNDSYWPRYISNLGIKSLTGKDLKDFGHDYREREIILTVPWRYPTPSAQHAETKASRFRAVAEYYRWLRDEKPEMYRLLDPHASIAITIQPIEFGATAPKAASNAWRMICDARQAYEMASLDRAKSLLEQAFTHAPILLEVFAEQDVSDDKRPSRKHLLNAIKFYQELLDQMDEPLSDDFPLKELIQTGQDAQ